MSQNRLRLSLIGLIATVTSLISLMRFLRLLAVLLGLEINLFSVLWMGILTCAYSSEVLNILISPLDILKYEDRPPRTLAE